MGLMSRDIDDLFTMFDEDGNGELDINEFLTGGYEVIADLARERAIAQFMYEANERAGAGREAF